MQDIPNVLQDKFEHGEIPIGVVIQGRISQTRSCRVSSVYGGFYRKLIRITAGQISLVHSISMIWHILEVKHEMISEVSIRWAHRTDGKIRAIYPAVAVR